MKYRVEGVRGFYWIRNPAFNGERNEFAVFGPYKKKSDAQADARGMTRFARLRPRDITLEKTK